MAPAADSECTKCNSKKRGDKLVQCAACHSTVHVSCIEGIDKTVAANLAKIVDSLPCIALFCCAACKSQFSKGNGDSPALKRLEEKFDTLAEFVGANLIDSSNSEDGFTTVQRKKKRNYASAASGGLQSFGLVQMVQQAVIAAPKVQQAEEERLKIVVIEGLSNSEMTDSDELIQDDLQTAGLILADLGCPRVKIDHTERLKNYSTDRPAIMKIFLKSKADRDSILRAKRKLRDSEQFNMCYIRPSIPIEERIRRDHLRQIAIAKSTSEGHRTLRDSPYRVLLNDSSEKYDLRRIENDRIDWKCAPVQFTATEWESAKKLLETKRVAGNRQGGGSS